MQVVALAMIEITGCRELSSPPVEGTQEVSTGTEEGAEEGIAGTEGVEEGAAATKLAAARTKAGMKERTRIVSKWKERRVSKDWSEEMKMGRNSEGKSSLGGAFIHLGTRKGRDPQFEKAANSTLLV
jgi:hypothetical protein